MAIGKCPECSRLVSTTAETCPHCGYKLIGKSRGCSTWIAIIIGIIVVLFIIDQFNGGSSTSTRSTTKTKMWYVGGTLHKATIAEWRTATAANKLATCSDFVAKIRLDKGIAYNEQEIKVQAYELVSCIDAAIVDVEVDNWKVSEMAVTCLVLLYN